MVDLIYEWVDLLANGLIGWLITYLTGGLSYVRVIDKVPTRMSGTVTGRVLDLSNCEKNEPIFIHERER